MSAVFTDAGGWTWNLTLTAAALRRLDAGHVVLRNLVERPPQLMQVLLSQAHLANVAAIILVDQAQARGLDYHGFLDRMIDVMNEPEGADRLLFTIVFAIVKAFPRSAIVQVFHRGESWPQAAVEQFEPAARS